MLTVSENIIQVMTLRNVPGELRVYSVDPLQTSSITSLKDLKALKVKISKDVNIAHVSYLTEKSVLGVLRTGGFRFPRHTRVMCILKHYWLQNWL